MYTGTDYWRQMVVYYLLCEASPIYNKYEATGSLEFLEGEDIKSQEIKITEDDKHLVLDEIKETYANIMNHQFENGCGETWCNWCSFVSAVKAEGEAKVDLQSGNPDR